MNIISYFINTFNNFKACVIFTYENALKEIEKIEKPAEAGSTKVWNGGPLSKELEPLFWVNDLLFIVILINLNKC